MTQIQELLSLTSEVLLRLQERCSFIRDRNTLCRERIALLALPAVEPPDFTLLGCTSLTDQHLRKIFVDTCNDLRNACQRAFCQTACLLPESAFADDTEVALRRRYIADFLQSTEKLVNVTSRQVIAACLHADAVVAASSSVPFTFPPDVNAILLRAFDHCNIVTKAERRELAQATGLDDRQIATWVSIATAAL